MKTLKILVVVIVMLCLSGCLMCKVNYTNTPWEATGDINGVATIGTYTAIEECAVKATHKALIEVKATNPKWAYINIQPDYGIMFIRDPDAPMPMICDSCFFGLWNKDCSTTWREVPFILKFTPTNPPGYNGLAEPNIFISRLPKNNNLNDLMNLLAHEWGCHVAADIWKHGDSCTEITKLVQRRATEIMSDPDGYCSLYTR